ncbi:VanZ family protein [Streptococcus himalayensis]
MLPPAKRFVKIALIGYGILLGLMCFTPQISDGIETPGIEHFGRVVVLLTPFNSFVRLGEITSIWQFGKVVLQNIMNIFLLFPLIFQLLLLFPSLRKKKRVLVLSFLISLGIELTQILLDIAFDANRVFEIDDLWTNTLGGYLAYQLFKKMFTYKKPVS